NDTVEGIEIALDGLATSFARSGQGSCAKDIPRMHVPTLIEKKREGKELTDDEINRLVSGFTSGEVADFQVSAWAMAVFFQGMTPAETHHLTKAMMESGSVLDYPAGSPPKVE